MDYRKRFRWILILAILLTFVTVFIIRIDTVQATFTDMYGATVLLRVEKELMQKTPAGQYYDSLFWKHSEEIGQILLAQPESHEEITRVMRLYVPGLEALLSGEGDTIRITAAQVDGFRAQLDWFYAKGSFSLRKDIQREQERLPLDNFIDMTMSEAWDYINSKWTPDMVVPQPSTTPAPVLQPTLMPTPHVMVEKGLVPGTGGEWSYYVLNGVYLEFPTEYYLPPQKLGIPSISFMPSEDFPEQLDSLYMYADIGNVPVAEEEKLDPHNWYLENIVWERVIEINGFKGTEFISQMPEDSVMHLSVILYNEESQTAVHLSVPHIPSIPQKSDYMELINRRYPYFQHIVDNIRIETP